MTYEITFRLQASYFIVIIDVNRERRKFYREFKDQEFLLVSP